MTCPDVESALTAYVDGEASASVSEAIAAHLGECSVCREAEQTERAGRDALRRHAALVAARAPASLRAQCLSRTRARFWAPRRASLAAVAGLLLVAGLLAVGVFQPVPVFAAQLTVDHWKCAHVGPSPISSDPDVCAREWLRSEGWAIVVPSGAAEDMTLRGIRRCFVTEGRLAHLIYDRQGEAVSVFVLADGHRFAPGAFAIFGHEAVIWQSRGRTYALVARGDRSAVVSLAAIQQDLRAEERGGR
jgi:anti-sigma factor RsiW